jgi:hypothetical protein
VLVATQALAAGVRLRAEECVVECVEASPEEAEEGTREGSDSEDEIRLYGEGEEAAPISDVEGDGSDDVAEEPGAKRAPRPKVGSEARPYRAKQWVDELRLHLTGTQMWCHLTKRGNLNLCIINVNGKPMGWELQRLLLQLSNGSDCPIDGFVLIDTRTRAPSLVDGKEKSEGDRKFNAISWIWNFLLPDRVARSQLNQSHVGVILTGDLNQRLDNSDQSRRSLRVRTEAMGLYANLAERFQHLDSEYSTWGRGRLDLKGVHMIDHVFTSLPDQVFRAGGSPGGEEWEAVSDHLPVCGSFHFGQLQVCVEGRQKKYIAKPAPSLRLENAADRAAAAADMALEWRKMTKGLRILCRLSAIASNSVDMGESAHGRLEPDRLAGWLPWASSSHSMVSPVAD